MRRQSRKTSNGDIGRVVVGIALIVMGLMIWGQNAADLGVMLNGGRGSLTAGFLVVATTIGGIAFVLIGLLWRGPERRR